MYYLYNIKRKVEDKKKKKWWEGLLRKVLVELELLAMTVY